jgi:hypothetical protein
VPRDPPVCALLRGMEGVGLTQSVDL